MLLRGQIASIASASFLANHIVPAPQPNAQQETWTQDSLYMVFSYLCVFQVLPKSNTGCDLLSSECSTYCNVLNIEGLEKLPSLSLTDSPTTRAQDNVRSPASTLSPP